MKLREELARVTAQNQAMSEQLLAQNRREKEERRNGETESMKELRVKKSEREVPIKREPRDEDDEKLESDLAGGMRPSNLYLLRQGGDRGHGPREHEDTWLAEQICHRCEEKGHIKSDCPLKENDICGRCGARGHWKRECPRKK